MRPIKSSGRAALMSGLGPRFAIAASLAAGALLLAGCLGGGDSKHGVTHADRRASAPRQDGLVEVHTITYTASFGGSDVTALVAIPRAAASRGCVIAQFGL